MKAALGGLLLAACGLAAVRALPAPNADGTGKLADAARLPFYGDRIFTPSWTPSRHRISSFALVDQEGNAFRDGDLAGRIHVASFLFTTCPSVCPTLVTRLKPVQEKARDWPDVRLVSYSVTPERDTPEVLAAFGRARGIDPARWSLLTGDTRQIARLLRESYFADDDRKLPSAATDRKLLHSEKVLLVDGALRLRGVYDGTLAIEIEHLLDDVARLRQEGSAILRP